jgi:hypothetical protein
MTTKRATAPKMTVMRVDRVGGWGSVNYHHSLECTHTEVRRRCAKVGDRIACVRCQEVLERRAALAELAPTNQISNTDEAVAAEMTQESRIKANIASLLGIPVDTIAVALGPTRQIVIFLSPQEVTRLSGT